MDNNNNLSVAEASTEALVDKGYKLKSKIDDLSAELELIKTEVKNRAEKVKAEYFLGKKHFAKVSPTSRTNCDPRTLYDLCKELKNVESFFDLVSVQITPARALLGETLLGTISSTDVIPFNSVSFKEKVPKKYAK